MSKTGAGGNNNIYVLSRRCVARGSTISIGVERNAVIGNNVYPTVGVSELIKIYKIIGNRT